MNPFVGELLGTALFVLLGCAVQANVLLARTKGENGGGGGAWLLIAFGWAMAVFVGATVAASASGAHLNPVVTLGLWLAGAVPQRIVAPYLAGQFLGAALGAILVFLLYLPHWARTDDPARKLACFATAPAVRAPLSNCFSEALGAFVFVLGLLFMREMAFTPGASSATGAVTSAAQSAAAINTDLGALGALPMALLYLAIGLGVGGTTSFAINPARDLVPRLVHAIAPIPGKGSSDWGYAWVPVIGPLLGGAAAALVARALNL